jgi:branched-chain amino acid aminotransferase
MPTPYAYFRGEIVPLEQAKVGVMTHSFNYGTAVFEGIRGNWNKEDQAFYLFRAREHFERLALSAKVLALSMRDSVDRLCEIAVELTERSGYEEDVYLRPMVYTSGEVLGVRLHNVEHDTLMFIAPFGPYLDVDAGARCHTSTWRRVSDLGIPPRAKVVGIYVNSALAKTEANQNGYDEAIMLNDDGHVSEGSGENIFVVRKGVIYTPTPADNVLEGITGSTVVELAAAELGVKTVERQIDRSELYVADEVFMTGTAAHVTPVVEVDRRPVGDGRPGPITRQLSKLYFDAIYGRNAKYRHWCTPARVRIAR